MRYLCILVAQPYAPIQSDTLPSLQTKLLPHPDFLSQPSAASPDTAFLVSVVCLAPSKAGSSAGVNGHCKKSGFRPGWKYAQNMGNLQRV